MSRKICYLVERGYHYLQGMPGGEDAYEMDYCRMKPRFTVYKFDAYPFRRITDAQNIIRVLNTDGNPNWHIMKMDRVTGEVWPACQ